MANTSQKRAIENYRKRLRQRGITRFEVLGLNTDRGLIRCLAKRLTENGPDARRIRPQVSQTIAGSSRKKGGLLAVLRLPRMAGLELEIERPFETGRKIDL